MIPSTTAFLEQDFKITEQPTHTYKMNHDNGHIRGYTDGIEAIKQAIFKILSTETLDLYGEPVSYVCPELERRITEALLWDDRIQSIDNFEFDVSKKGEVHVNFTAHTVFGDVQAEKVVNF